MKVAITTLGCDKNTCDSETLAGALKAQGHTFVARDQDADMIIVNTCAFIKSARNEAIRVIKSKFKHKAKIVVTGCLTKYPDLIPAGVEVWGIGSLRGANGNEAISGQKLLSTPPSYAYIKISDGCDNRCTYCTIPSIRGSYKPRAEREILDEISRFANLGVGEFILVAQDLTKYPNLVGLVRNISKIRGVQRIRLHYVYPSGVTDELIDEIKSNPKVCKYIDIPFQHVSPRILKLMNRKPCDCPALVQKLQGVTIRSTFMIGFPSETNEDFEMLCDFLKTARLDYVGFFKYSREQGTPAYLLPQQIDEKTKNARLQTVQTLQNSTLFEKHRDLIGQTLKVVCDYCDDVLGYSVTRSESQSPEVDPCIIVSSKMQAGEYREVKITGTDNGNLIGELV